MDKAMRVVVGEVFGTRGEEDTMLDLAGGVEANVKRECNCVGVPGSLSVLSSLFDSSPGSTHGPGT